MSGRNSSVHRQGSDGPCRPSIIPHTGYRGHFPLESAAGTLTKSRRIGKIASIHRKKPHGELKVTMVFIISALHQGNWSPSHVVPLFSSGYSLRHQTTCSLGEKKQCRWIFPCREMNQESSIFQRAPYLVHRLHYPTTRVSVYKACLISVNNRE
jgi:hypothetical protein